VTGHGPAVVINTTQPAETKIALAKQVVKNMDLGVDYVYFFRAQLQNAQIVSRLLQSLVLARLTDRELKEGDRISFIKQDPQRVVKSLGEIRERLYIHFLPHDRAPLLFCVHNARLDNQAICYPR
jgi:hypothetical protein